jgi:hypothetical protein
MIVLAIIGIVGLVASILLPAERVALVASRSTA